MREVTDEKLDKYFSVTKEALDMANAAEKDQENLDKAEDFLDMATRYYEDAKHFRENGEIVTALPR